MINAINSTDNIQISRNGDMLNVSIGPVANVTMSDTTFQEFQMIHQIHPQMVPYQSLDMRRKGTVRYVDRSTYLAFTNRKDQYNRNKKRSLYPFDLSSDIDLFKMNRPTNKFEYLVDIDPNVDKHQHDIVRVINSLKPPTDNKLHFTFIPYIPGVDIDINNIESHNAYNSISLIENEKFVAYLRQNNPDKIGELLYQLNNLLSAYQRMNDPINQKNGVNSNTMDNLIDTIMDVQRDKIYGINKQTISRRLWDRNELLKKYSDTIANCDISTDDSVYEKLYGLFASQTTIGLTEPIKHIYDGIKRCNGSKLHLNDLIYDIKVPINMNVDKNYQTCTHMSYAPTDTFTGRTFYAQCMDYLSPELKSKSELFNITNPTDASKCMSLGKEENPKFTLHEEYMPEWLHAVNEGNIEEAFNHRPLLLGDIKITSFFKRCSVMARSDPFIKIGCEMPGLGYDIELNKLIISCVLDSTDIFPIRIVNAKSVPDSRLYEPFVLGSKDKFIGSMVLPLKGSRTQQKTRYYVIYLYMNMESPFMFKTIDFRSNILIPGSIVEYTRALYLELNTILYFDLDIGFRDGSVLHYYKLNTEDGYDILVSRYDKETIRNMYANYGYNNSLIDDLVEMRLIKNFDKKFSFEKLNSKNKDAIQTGGMSINSDELSFVFEKKEYEWDIKYELTPIPVEKQIYPLVMDDILQKSIKYYSSIMGDNFATTKCSDIREFYRGSNTKGIISKFFTNFSPEQVNSVEYKKYINSIPAHNNLLSYKFEGTLSYYIYALFKKFNLYNTGDKISIIAKNNTYILDGILYYLKYSIFEYDKDNVLFFLYPYKSLKNQETYDYINNNNINYVEINEPLSNDQINIHSNNMKKIDIGVVDLMIYIHNSIRRYDYMFQTYFSGIILTLKKLNKNGVLIVNTMAISNKMVFDFMVYLANHFNESFIYEFPDKDIRNTNLKFITSIIIFKGYNKPVDLDKLLYVNKLNYEYDPTGGFNYGSSEKYLNSIVKISDDNEMYSKYKKYLKDRMFDMLSYVVNEYNNYLDKDFASDRCEFMQMKAIFLAKKYGLPLADWMDKIPNEYFEYIITKYIDNINFTKQFEIKYKLPNFAIGVHSKINAPYQDKLKKNYELSELAYQYTEKIDLKKYKSIELFVNNKYKKLNNELYDKYNVNINNKVPSRAWLKMYELLFDVDFLGNFDNMNTLKGFHICEAPGNFINSIAYYIKNNTKIGLYDWKAQSLSSNLADFYDSYGFIKKTQDRWDLGPKKSGDITDYENFLYYYKMYGGKMDILVADCGEKWSAEVSLSNDISIFQMLYAILFPKTGGNFIIKSYSTNYNLLYLSLLFVSCHVFDKVLVFKSNLNFWSPEIYIIGIGKKQLSKGDTDKLFQVVHNVTKNIYTYPVDTIPDDFCMMYQEIMNKYILEYTDIKKFFVFLSKNDDLFNMSKDKLSDVIDRKNREWINKYMRKAIKN